MNKIYNPKLETWTKILKRPTQTIADIEATVNEIFSEVKTKGDEAVKKYTQLFDGILIDNLLVSNEEIVATEKEVSSELKYAINLAKSNIEKFHSAQKTERITIETTEGVSCWQEKRPIQKVGLYIPGGSAPLFSTVLMLAIPANIAGCNEIVLFTPPDKNGKINPAILYTAKLCGVTKIFKVGGIQAIAAMTFGTETVPSVYKIFGPGNQFVTVAKQIATKHGVAIDMPAGPSELLVFADDTANASFVASDLLSQAEHGADSQVILVTTSEKLLNSVEKEIEKQLHVLPRKALAAQAIYNSKLILVQSNAAAIRLINEYSPEHFIVVSKDEEFFIENIQNAGSVFIGNYTPESAGDYASGTNHTLPTNGYTKQYSGVNLDSFMKSMTFQKISEKGIQNIGKAIEIMAEAEGLQAHKNAVTLRLKSLEKMSGRACHTERSRSAVETLISLNMINKFDAQTFIRPNVAKMKPYSSARDEFKDFDNEMIFLDANENPFETNVNRYPDPQQLKLKELLSKQKDVPINQILLGNGSDEVLDLIFRAFCEPAKDNVISLPPTYGMYGVLANLNNIENREVLLDSDFQPDLDEISRTTDTRTKLLFVCSPNNPTGNLIASEKILKLLKNFNGLIVIDEAYIDFASQESWITKLNEFPNLIVTQTLSKAYGLAGIRLGICYGSAEIISVLNKIKPPYNINELTQQSAIEQLQNIAKIKTDITYLYKEKEALLKALVKVSYIKKIHPSDANFILIKVDNAEDRYAQLLENGIVVRNRSSQPLCANTLRITIGTTSENKKLITTLKTLK